ncbi:MAG TPA: hypothetical protein VGD29_03340 [Actinoplanes sp.]
MNCPHCGSTAVQPSGTCSSCGRSVSAPSDPTALHYPPPVDPFATSAPLTGTDPLAPYAPPADPYPAPNDPAANDPAPNHQAPNHPAANHPTSGQPGTQPPPGPPSPYGTQPTPTQPYPGQPTPTQPYPGQPYPGQPTPTQPYPGQPAQQYPGQPYPPQAYGQQPYPEQSTAQGFSITAYVLAAIAVFFVPIVFGLAAIIFAAVARRRGERNAQLAMRLAVAGMLLGFFLGRFVNLL